MLGVSFVVPVYNGERSLEGCLEAIFTQADGRTVEVIVVDDRSTDRSIAILESYQAEGKLQLVRGRGQGAAAALNAGIRLTCQPIICQVDQDVVLEAGWMKQLVGALEATPRAAAAQGYYATPRPSALCSRVAGYDLEQRYSRLNRGFVNHVCTGNAAYRRDALDDVGLFDENLGYGYDNDLSYRLGDAGYRLLFVPEARSQHLWPSRLGAYLVKQYGLGYGRLDLLAKHRRRFAGDDVSGVLMMLHAPALLLSLGAMIAGGSLALAGQPWQLCLTAGAALFTVIAAERSIAGVRAAVAFRDAAGLFFAPVHVLRDLAWCTAILVWLARRLGGQKGGPNRSMLRHPVDAGPRPAGGASSRNDPSLATVIPAHNEAASLEGVVRELRRACPQSEIVVVDDGSTDATARLLPGLEVRWLRLRLHLGVGSAVRAGLRYAHELGHDLVVRMDGDGQHCADQIQTLLEPLRTEQCDAVLGSRYLNGAGYQTRGWRRLGQRALSLTLSLVAGQRITDPTSGFWAFGPRSLRLLAQHHPTGYPEPELFLLLHRNGLRTIEVPVVMRPRRHGRTSLTPAREAVAIARALLALLIVPWRAPAKVGGSRR